MLVAVGGVLLLALAAVTVVTLGGGDGSDSTSGTTVPAVTTEVPTEATSAVTGPGSSEPTTAPSPATPAGLKPWSQSEAAVTSRSGNVTVVPAESLVTGASGAAVLLQSGQSVAFEKMRTLEIVSVLPDTPRAVFRVQAVITLLTGETISEVVDSFTELRGSNSLGDLRVAGSDVLQVDFRR